MKIIKRVVRILGIIVFCGLSAYDLFWGILSVPNISTQTDAMKWLLCAIVIALMYPGIIMVQYFTIRKLKN